MKEVANIKKVSLTFNELMNCKSVPTNRCGFLSEKEALANGFSSVDWDKFVSRAKKLKKTILSQGFSKASFFVLAKDENNDIYILDGQGRRKALSLINENNNIAHWEFVCDLYTEPMSLLEMSRLIKDMNTVNTNWQTKDVRRSDAITSDDEEVKIAYAYTKQIMDDYELGDYIVNLLTFGECASHQRKNNISLSTRHYAITKGLFTDAYLRLVTSLSYTIDKNGNEVEHTKSVKKAIRNTNFAISFVSCLRSIVEIHKGNIADATEDVNYFVDKLIEMGKGNGAYVADFVKCIDKKKEVVANKVRSRCRKATIAMALYGFGIKNVA